MRLGWLVSAVVCAWLVSCGGGSSKKVLTCDPSECSVGEAGMPDSGVPPQPEGGEGGAPPDVTPVADAGEAGAVSANAGATGADSQLVIVIDGHGTVAVSGQKACLTGSCSYVSELDTTFQLQAKPDADSRFVGWSGDCSGSAASTSVEVSGARECVATFAVQRAVSAAVSAAGGGSVVTDPNLACSASACKGVVDDGSHVTFKATPQAGYRFLTWSGGSDCEGLTQATLNLKITQDLACTASFAKQYAVAVSAVGATAQVSVTNGKCTGLVCQADEGTGATFQAAPVAGFRFTGWTGDAVCTGTKSPLEISKVTSGIACVANYAARYTATGVVGGGHVGTVSATGNVNATCAGNSCTVDAGTSVTLVAPTIDTYYLSGWSGCTGTQSGSGIVVTPSTGNINCTANYVLGVSVSGTVVGAAGTVTATSTSPGFDCKKAGTCAISPGGTVTLAAPATITGYRFNGWSGDAGCTGATTTITLSNVTSSKSCSANYVQQFTIAAVAGTGGTVSASKGTPCAGNSCTVDKDVSVSLGASADTANGYHFNGWTGVGCPGSTNPLTLVNVNATCMATFALDAFTITAKSGTGGSAKATRLDTNVECPGDSCAVSFGTSVRLDAIPAANYHFNGWAGPSCPTSGNPITLKNVSATCTAAFAINTFAVTASANPVGSGAVVVSCPGNCGAVAYGQSVNFNATPNAGWAFASWSANCAAGTATITANTACVATFRPVVTGTVAPTASGTITGVGTGNAACVNGSTATCAVDSGAQVTLTALPAANYAFSSWSGDCAGTQAAVTVTGISTPKNCTASFYRLWARSTGGTNVEGTPRLVSLADGTLVSLGQSLPEGGKQNGLALVDLDAGTGKLGRNQRIVDGNAAGELAALGLTTTTDQKNIVALGLHTSRAGQAPYLHSESPLGKFDLEYSYVKGSQAAAIGGEVISTSDGGYAFCAAVLDQYDVQGVALATSHLTKVDQFGAVTFDVNFAVDNKPSVFPTRPFDVIQDPKSGEFVVLSQALTPGYGLLLTFITKDGVYESSVIYRDSVDLIGAQLVPGSTADSYFVVGSRIEGRAVHDGFFAELSRKAATPVFAFSLGNAGSDEQFTSVTKNSDGSYAVAGFYAAAQGNDAWLVLISKDGKVTAQLGYGGPNDELLSAITSVPGGGFGLGGTTTSWGSAAADSDFWTLRVGPDGKITFNPPGLTPLAVLTTTLKYTQTPIKTIVFPDVPVDKFDSAPTAAAAAVKVNTAGFAQVIQSK